MYAQHQLQDPFLSSSVTQDMTNGLDLGPTTINPHVYATANNITNNGEEAATKILCELRKSRQLKARYASEELRLLWLHMFTQQLAGINNNSTTTISKNGNEETFKLYLTIYMRNFERLNTRKSSDDGSGTSSSRRFREKNFIDSWKQQHGQLNKEEWRFFKQNFIDQLLVADKMFSLWDNSEELQQFAMILQHYEQQQQQEQQQPQKLNACENLGAAGEPSSSSISTTSRRPSLSSSPSLLTSSLTAGATPCPKKSKLTLEEVVSLYICCYFPNYEELWDAQSIILQQELVKYLGKFVELYPSMDPCVYNSLMNIVEKRVRHSM